MPDLLTGGAALWYGGARCVVRPLTGADVRHLYPMPEVAAALLSFRPGWSFGQDALDALAERLDWFARLSPPVEVEALIEHRPSGTPVGFLCLSSIDTGNAKAEFSAAFFRGRGTRCTLEALHWALEASFRAFALHKLVFHVLPHNRPALDLLDTLGARREAVLASEIVTADGSRSDLWRYALFQPDWMAGVPRRRLQRLAPLRQEED